MFEPLGMDFLDSRRKSNSAGKVIAVAFFIAVCIVMLKQVYSPSYTSPDMVCYYLDYKALCLQSMPVIHVHFVICSKSQTLLSTRLKFITIYDKEKGNLCWSILHQSL